MELVAEKIFRPIHYFVMFGERGMTMMPIMKEYKRMLPVEQVELYNEVLRSLDSVAICIDASEWEIPEDGWYNATHLTKEASVEFTIKIARF